jgi:hypothetical protein
MKAMERNTSCNIPAGISSDSEMIRHIFEPYVEESISDEQVQRILAPIREMILAGKFNRRRRFLRKYAIPAAIAAFLLTIILPLATVSGFGDEIREITDNPVPLAGPVLEENTLSGRVMMEGSGVEGIAVALVDTEQMKSVGIVTSLEEGSYILTDVPDGSYRLTTILPPSMDVVSDTIENTWIIVDGTAEIIFGGEAGQELEGADIWVSQTLR